MIREVLIAVLAAVLVGGVAGMSHAAGATTWGYSVVESQVSQGAMLDVIVTGPPNGTFTVTLNPLPFNTSTPIYSSEFALPSAISLSNGTTIGSVQINTTLFAIAGYQLTVAQTGGLPVGNSTIVHITPPSDATLQNQIDTISETQLIDNLRIQSLLYLRSEALGWTEFAVGFSLGTFAILLYLIIATRTSARERRLVEKTLSFGHRLLWQTTGVVHTGAWSLPKEESRVDPTVTFVARKPRCSICELPTRRDAMASHLVTAHRVDPSRVDSEVVSSRAAEERIRSQIRQEIERERPRTAAVKEAARSSKAEARADLSFAVRETDGKE